MYRDHADVYDLIYSFKDYKKESQKIIKLIHQYQYSNGKKLLELGCGTGKHLQYFARAFDCLGTDVNEGILAQAKQKHPAIQFKKVNMVQLKLNRKFDAIISLFSAIGYVKTLPNLRKTIHAIGRHLKKGGVVVIEPWFSPESYYPGKNQLITPDTYALGKAHMTTYDGKGVKIARLNVSKRKGDISILDFHFMVAKDGQDVVSFVDRHELGLFTQADTLRFFEEAGIRTKYLKNGLSKGRGLFVGVKQ